MDTIQTLIDATALGAVYALMGVGIGLVFGVLRIVNFAYGQLIMAGAYTLALTSGWNPALSIVTCFAVVLGLTVTLDLVAFRPLRRAAPATMLVATFAISLLLYYVALLRFTVQGKTVGTLTGLNRPIGHGTLIVRWIWVVDVIVVLIALGALLLLLLRTNLGLHMRAAATDFRTARLLGVRANSTIFVAVLLSGALAAVVLLSTETPYITPDYALRDTIIVLVGCVVGGLDRLWSATLGAFSIGFASQALAGFLPSTGSWPFTSGVYLDSAVFALVILTLLLRPDGLFVPRGQRPVERV
jgi:branched-chain amino acid transport system permease protein